MAIGEAEAAGEVEADADAEGVDEETGSVDAAGDGPSAATGEIGTTRNPRRAMLNPATTMRSVRARPSVVTGRPGIGSSAPADTSAGSIRSCSVPTMIPTRSWPA